ncbi:PWWP domain-containing DNA repair factor 3A isoform X1 [Protopterus annectens]|uniref:PWWP domain-containing DNA repair factor 3A isoform X1 n=1 Tax=Protopterus annectens TaxID=7888 RepID=UPI001CF9D2B9|nr:PWWP domain-containing DNA repair factor 3A isoform X1 [Protopterus annectens]XP_043909942.1 PWWP domain-containing DNA repair factor 3A isoform X1 [Protopterus annectens]
MAVPQYIFCKWKGRFWPAKILARTDSKKTPCRGCTRYLNVEILVSSEQVKVKDVNTRSFEERFLEEVCSELKQNCNQSVEQGVEELNYRKAIRAAVELLRGKKVPHSRSPLEGQQTSRLREKKKQTEDAGSPSKPSFQNNKYAPKSSEQSFSPEKECPVKRGKKDSGDSYRTLGKYAECNAKLSCAKKGKTKEARKTVPESKHETANQSALDGSDFACHHQHHKGETCQNEAKPVSPMSPKSLRRKVPYCQTETSNDCTDEARSDGLCSTSLSPIRSKLQKTAKGAKDECLLPAKNLNQSTPKKRKIINEFSNSSIKDKASRKKEELDLVKVPLGTKTTQGLNQECVMASKLNEANKRNCKDEKRLRTRSFPEALPFEMHLRHPKANASQKHSPKQKITQKRTKVKQELPDFETDENELAHLAGSDQSSIEDTQLMNSLLDDLEDDEEEVELPSFLSAHEPCAIADGNLVWCKLQKYPYWPAVVKRVIKKGKKASVVFIDDALSEGKKDIKGFTVSLRKLKPLDCEERQHLIDAARERFRNSFDWCNSLVNDYLIRRGCSSFEGTFLEYCSSEMSYPVRKELKQGNCEMTFPSNTVVEEDSDDFSSDSAPSKEHTTKKFLPDRAKASRKKSNAKLVDFIVMKRGTEKHLKDILKRKKSSRWYDEYKNRHRRRMAWVDLYLEDDEQLDLVVNYLLSLCNDKSRTAQDVMDGDKTRFVLDVLLPEAIISAISCVEELSYAKAEEKYLAGPVLTRREKEEFEHQLAEECKARAQQSRVKPSS